MSEHDKTGGPAFPTSEWTADGEHIKEHHGMTLRDYFAAKALPILWDAYDKGYCGITVENEFSNTLFAKGAYQIADAMLKARES